MEDSEAEGLGARREGSWQLICPTHSLMSLATQPSITKRAVMTSVLLSPCACPRSRCLSILTAALRRTLEEFA